MTIFPQHFQLFTCSSLNSLVSHWAWAKPKTPDKKTDELWVRAESKLQCEYEFYGQANASIVITEALTEAKVEQNALPLANVTASVSSS